MKAAYCTDKYLIVHSIGNATHKDGLLAIPRPPGGGTPGLPYSQQCVTRSYHNAFASYKQTLSPVLLSTSTASNNLIAFSGQTDPASLSSIGLPSAGAVAVTITGQSLYPLFNNVGSPSHANCEMDFCSAHAGQGFGKLSTDVYPIYCNAIRMLSYFRFCFGFG